MTKQEIQIAMAQQYVSACLRSALAEDEKNKGGFNGSQYKAWLDYDEALALLSKLLTSKS